MKCDIVRRHKLTKKKREREIFPLGGDGRLGGVDDGKQSSSLVV